MKKRIISIFLIISIIASLFAVSAISTSAVTTPTITSVVVYPTKINVNWTKGSNISYYAVWVLNKSTGKWSAYKSSKTYINFDKLKPGINYGFQVRAVDYQGRISGFSASRRVKFTYPQKPEIVVGGSIKNNRVWLAYGVRNYDGEGGIATWIPYAKSYDLIAYKYKNGKTYHSVQKSYAISFKNEKGVSYSFKVRAYCVYNGKGYLSPWSDVESLNN